MADRSISSQAGATAPLTTLGDDDLLVISRKDGATYEDATIEYADLEAQIVETAADLPLPSFEATQTSAQTIAHNTATVIVCETELADTGTYYDTTTGKFTPLVAGTYAVCGQVSIDSIVDTGAMAVLLRKNGSITKRVARVYLGVAGSPIAGGTQRFYLDGTDDYVELIGFHTHGSNRDTIPGDTEFSAWRISPDDICGV
jgi:hypothetical protein